MANTVSLGLPLLVAEQAQKHVTHNEALRALDAIVQLSVKDRDFAAPRDLRRRGDRYIVAASATGVWAGHEADVAVWQDGAWDFHDPREGWRCWVDDENVFLIFNGSAWVDWGAALGAIQNLSLLGIGTTADATNPFSAKLNKALWTAKTAAEGGDGDLRYTMNKETAADVLSLLLQTGFSGRAEIGLIGDDDLTFKVSADGSTFKVALAADKTTGGVRFLANQVDVASAATCDIGAAAALKVRVTGTTTITSFGSVAYAFKVIQFNGALTLTHNATSLILPGGANIATADGDTAIVTSDSSGNWRVRAYQRANGKAVIASSLSDVSASGALALVDWTDIASASTTDLGSIASNFVRITGTTTITGLGTSAATVWRFVRFAGALTLTYNATSLILPGAANIATAAGDCALFKSEGSGNWRCLAYWRASGKAVIASTYADVGVREKLAATRIYYVRTDGSDSNDGLANTSGGAFLTIGKAITVVAALDLAGFSVTVQLAAGSYNIALTLKDVLGGAAIIVGDETTPSNVSISTSGTCVTIDGVKGSWAIRGMKLASSGGHGILADNGSQFSYRNLEFGACAGTHVYTGIGVLCAGGGTAYKISGSAGYHWLNLGGRIAITSYAVTLTGTPAFTTFANIQYAGSLTISASGGGFTGSATGARYDIRFNSIIDTNGGGASFFPGNSAGSTSTGGQYG